MVAGVCLSVAARLGVILPDAKAVPLLRHDDFAVRADACRCVVHPERKVIAVLIDLLDDIHDAVSQSAARALGRMGRHEARAILLNMVRQNPDAEAINAIARIADEDCIVLLKRIALSDPALADAVQDALEIISA